MGALLFEGRVELFRLCPATRQPEQGGFWPPRVAWIIPRGWVEDLLTAARTEGHEIGEIRFFLELPVRRPYGPARVLDGSCYGVFALLTAVRGTRQNLLALTLPIGGPQVLAEILSPQRVVIQFVGQRCSCSAAGTLDSYGGQPGRAGLRGRCGGRARGSSAGPVNKCLEQSPDEEEGSVNCDEQQNVTDEVHNRSGVKQVTCLSGTGSGCLGRVEGQ